MTQTGQHRPPQPLRPRQVPEGVLTTVRRKDRLVAGVCSGIGARYGVDPLLVRVAFVLLGLSMGIGLVLYAFCAMWMVEEGSDEPWIHQQVPSSVSWNWTGVMVGLVVASIITVSVTGSLSPFGPLPGLVLLGVWLWARRSRRRASAPLVQRQPAQAQYRPMTQFDAASMAWQSRLEAVYLSDEPLAPAPPSPLPVFDPYTEPSTVAAAVPARLRSAKRSSWAATVVMLLAAAAAFGAVDALVPDGTYRWLLPSTAALAVIGLSLLVGSFTRRPHLAILSGLVALATMFVSLQGPNLQPLGPSGHTSYTSPAEVPAQVDLRYRDSVLDFSGLALTRDQTVTVNVTVSTVIISPPGSYEVEYRLEGASLKDQEGDLGGGYRQGTLVRRQPDQPTLTIVLLVRGGEVTLT